VSALPSGVPEGVQLRLWRITAVGASVVAFAALVTLVVVYGTKAQALESTAILVAIIAFLVQLIVFIAQGVQSNATAVRLEQIAAELARTLAIVETELSNMGSDVQELRRSNRRVATDVADETAEELAERPTTDPLEIAELVRELVENRLERAHGDDSATRTHDGPMDRRRRRHGSAEHQRLGDPSAEERELAAPVLAALSDDAFYELTRVKAIENTIPEHKAKGAWTERNEADGVIVELIDAGLIDLWPDAPADRQDRRGQRFVALKEPLGVAAGRVLHEDGYLGRYLSKQPLRDRDDAPSV
jgi:hypothetical protein